VYFIDLLKFVFVFFCFFFFFFVCFCFLGITLTKVNTRKVYKDFFVYKSTFLQIRKQNKNKRKKIATQKDFQLVTLI
jgi:hypothetical protein